MGADSRQWVSELHRRAPLRRLYTCCRDCASERAPGLRGNGIFTIKIAQRLENFKGLQREKTKLFRPSWFNYRFYIGLYRASIFSVSLFICRESLTRRVYIKTRLFVHYGSYRMIRVLGKANCLSRGHYSFLVRRRMCKLDNNYNRRSTGFSYAPRGIVLKKLPYWMVALSQAARTWKITMLSNKLSYTCIRSTVVCIRPWSGGMSTWCKEFEIEN